ncbi:hypothetical protein [Allobranchiibius sp. CTAmp26]|uniref:hypothetical protein n=1 Tax=Allobranchiibius sp. CTAmp26 TaxID=2815214 RepID=UPI001AA1BE0B|nr:hypothetical protein [Allobranchiibius sp. CTAmp26]MBO1754759.1 hypothetical protein [Allobranchiibius sp. CTAmp26]
MGDQHDEKPDEDEPERGGSDEDVDASPEEETDSPVSPGELGLALPLIDPEIFRIVATLPPLIDPAIFGAIDQLRFQSTEIAAAVAPVTESLNLHLAESITRAWPKIDLTPLLPAFDVTTFLPKLDLAALMPDFRALLEDLRRHEPPNWPPGVDFDRVVEVIRDDGLPLVWVPRAELVKEVIDAEDRAARVAVLLAHVTELVHDCRTVLPGVTYAGLSGQRKLAARCVEALEQGHHEAAQALAVAVIETAVSRTLGGNYAQVKQQVLFDPDLVPYTELRLRAALAPIHRFYTDWSPKSPHPAPEAVSRHVSVHHADPSHYTEANSLIAVLLACSVLRALQELQQLVEASGPDQETA